MRKSDRVQHKHSKTTEEIKKKREASSSSNAFVAFSDKPSKASKARFFSSEFFSFQWHIYVNYAICGVPLRKETQATTNS